LDRCANCERVASFAIPWFLGFEEVEGSWWEGNSFILILWLQVGNLGR
jgi:hypothetical protein